MESRFGRDFTGVRVQSDVEGSRSAEALGATAYTLGQRMVFAPGRYAPETFEGRRLIAHELAHIVQQRNVDDGVQPERMAVSRPGDPSEREAEVAANNVVSGRQAGWLSPVQTPELRRSVAGDVGDLSKVPNDLTCPPVLGPPASPVGTAVIFATDSVSLAGTDWVVKAWVKLWTAHGARDDVTVDGYASTPGKQEHNWHLSCHRAEVVRDLLVKLGVPAGKIKPIAHGEATRFDSTDPLRNQRAVISPGYSGITPPGAARTAGLASRKAALLAAGGTLLDMAVAMLETGAMQVDYSFGDGKTGDAANFGIFKQNWQDIRLSGAMPPSGPGGKGLAEADWASRGPELNSNLSLDVNVLHASQKRLGINAWLAAHRQGQSGLDAFKAAAAHMRPSTPTELGLLSDIDNYVTGVRWIEEQLKLDAALQTDDRKAWVEVPAV